MIDNITAVHKIEGNLLFLKNELVYFSSYVK